MNLRRSHPNLYRAYLVYGLMCVALGLNFIFLNPTFDPLDIPKQVPGAIFLALGSASLFFLRVWRRATWLRVAMAVTIGAMFFWCGALVFDFFRLAQTSLQLPITFAALGALGIPLMLEPPVNLTTSEKDDE